MKALASPVNAMTLRRLGRLLGFKSRIVRPDDLTPSLSGNEATGVIHDEYEDTMAKKRKPKSEPTQEARKVVFPPNHTLGRKMPVTTRDPLGRRIVKRS